MAEYEKNGVKAKSRWTAIRERVNNMASQLGFTGEPLPDNGNEED